jgi:hypothetical protein
MTRLADIDAAEQPKRVNVWADPEIPGPPLYRSDIVGGYHRNLSYGWTWWSARHVVALPAGMTFLDALAHDGPIEVTVIADISPLASGLNEVNQRVDADWSSNRPEQRLIDPALLCEEVPKAGDAYSRSGGDVDDAADMEEEGGHWGDYFRKMRDIERRDQGLPRAVVRSDDYGRKPVYHLAHDWPDGTFTQGGNVRRDRGNGVEDLVFIETFPRDPSTYLRGEGATYAAAEAIAWARWEKIVACPAVAARGVHEFETRGYRNGAGFCRTCNLFQGKVFDLREIGSVCVVCAEPYYTEVRRRGSDGEWLTGKDGNGDRHYDMVCRIHHQSPALDGFDDMWDYLSAIDAHLDDPADPDSPLPDIDWMRHRLPADLSTAKRADLQDAYKHAQRDWLDNLIANKA